MSKKVVLTDRDIMAILKGLSIKLDDENIVILTFMYHTEFDQTMQKKDRSKSQYRFEGRKLKIADLQTEINKMTENPTEYWRWPTLDQYKINYAGEITNRRGARWLTARLAKAVDWQTAEMLLNGYKISSKDYKDSRKYEITGYTDSNGNQFDITLDALVALEPGTTFSKILTPKRAAK